MSKVCSKCKIEKDESEFYKKGDKLHSRCKSCELEYKRKYDAKNKDKSAEYREANREKRAAITREWRKNNSDKIKALMNKRKNELMELKTPCLKCGETRPWVIQFHHIDPSTKSFNVSFVGINGGVNEKVKNEISKCVCLCSNCHDEFHYFYGLVPEKPIEALEEYLSK